VHRMTRIVDWPARIAFSLGAAALLILFLRIPFPRTFDAIRIYNGVRTGAAAAVVGGGALLTVAWAQRRWREWGRSREKRREIRLATLMAHADPLTAQVDEQGQEIAGLAAGLQVANRKIDGLVAAIVEQWDKHGDPDASAALQKTQPLPLYLAAKDGQIVSKDQRDSA
jgi:hypothetical protein